MGHKGTVVLETERLILRPFKLNDLNSIYANCWSNYDVWKWTNYEQMSCVEDVIHKAKMFTEKWLNAYNDPKRYSWAIVVKETNEVIGRYFGMNLDDDLNEIELTYEIGQKWWNKGIVTEATKRIIKFFFEEVGINRLYAYHAKDNIPSGKVMQKCGMQYEGTHRESDRNNQGICDAVQYAILKRDWNG